jgi:ArsR family transcriptional regulator, arsenate/arsenite/antimonite-responsive transcriptional repressor
MQDGLFRALADPTRRRILELLAKGDVTAGDLAEQFPIGFSSISHHLSVLRQAGLVKVTREGQHMRYELNTTVFQEAVQYLSKLFPGGKRA